jgi:hypothetical protein
MYLNGAERKANLGFSDCYCFLLALPSQSNVNTPPLPIMYMSSISSFPSFSCKSIHVANSSHTRKLQHWQLCAVEVADYFCCCRLDASSRMPALSCAFACCCLASDEVVMPFASTRVGSPPLVSRYCTSGVLERNAAICRGVRPSLSALRGHQDHRTCRTRLSIGACAWRSYDGGGRGATQQARVSRGAGCVAASARTG